jgi:hypothetical protein
MTDWAHGKITIVPAPDAAWGFALAIDGVPQALPVEVAECFVAKRAATMTPEDMLRLADELEAVLREHSHPANPDDDKWREAAVRSIEIIRANNSRH